MVCCNDIPSVVNYGTSAVYKDLPSPEQVASGVVPLDSLPAAWWNAMWACNNVAFNCARTYIGQVVSELNTVLTQAGIVANCTCVDQLYQAITKLRRIVGDATYPGAVKSSSCPGEVSIDGNGVMTANCVGNASLLNTTAKNVVGAINELKSTYDTCWTNNTTALGGKAPTSHASTATTYGVGNATDYGHVKLSDTYDSCIGAAADSIAASQKALYCVYSLASENATVGNTPGCALGTAAAGTCITAARSDHVHPKQTLVNCSCYSLMESLIANSNRNVLLTSGTADNYSKTGVSTVCPLTFNPATGVLKSCCFCGNASYADRAGNVTGIYKSGVANNYCVDSCIFINDSYNICFYSRCCCCSNTSCIVPGIIEFRSGNSNTCICGNVYTGTSNNAYCACCVNSVSTSCICCCCGTCTNRVSHFGGSYQFTAGRCITYASALTWYGGTCAPMECDIYDAIYKLFGGIASGFHPLNGRIGSECVARGIFYNGPTEIYLYMYCWHSFTCGYDMVIHKGCTARMPISGHIYCM